MSVAHFSTGEVIYVVIRLVPVPDPPAGTDPKLTGEVRSAWLLEEVARRNKRSDEVILEVPWETIPSRDAPHVRRLRR